MNDSSMYDQFSLDYDRFVNWQERLAAEIPFLLRLLSSFNKKADRPSAVLDAACGTGHHLISLADHGYDCTGVDYSAEMIKIARKNVSKAGQKIDFYQAPFGEICQVILEKSFDCIICLGNSLPHILNSQSLLAALKDFKLLLNKNGKLIIQNRNFDKVLAEKTRWMSPQTFREDQKTWIFNRFYDFEPDGLITFNIQKLFSSDYADFSHDNLSIKLWPQTQKVMVESLEDSGFNSLSFYGDLGGSDYEPDRSENLVILAEN